MATRNQLVYLAIAVTLVALSGCHRQHSTSDRAPQPPPSQTVAATAAALIPAYYHQSVGHGSPGQLIHAEPLRSPAGVHAWRILYHSTDIHGVDIAVSGMAILPTALPPTGGRTVIAWAHGTTGSGDSCAPSVQPNPTASIEDLEPLVNQNFIIAATDYPGLGTPGPHPYLVGDSEARSVLDAVRAARQLPRAQASNRVIGWGHSQGGQAVLYAAQIARTYAPELTLLGTVAAAPAADVPALLHSITTTTDYGVGYLVLAASGYDAVDPRADLASIMTPASRALLPSVEAGCATTQDVFTVYNRMSIAQAFTRNPLSTAPWSSGFQQESAGGTPIRTPVLIVQGGKDTSVPEAITNQLVKELRSMHDAVTYRTYPNSNHDQVAQAAQPAINAWIRDRAAR